MAEDTKNIEEIDAVPVQPNNNTPQNGADVDENESSNKKEGTRSYIARLYVWAFFIIMGFVILVWSINFFVCNVLGVDDLKDMLVTISGVLSGPLGFIVGYYFKASKE